MENLSGNTSAKDAVLMFLTSVNNEDFAEARKYADDSLTFDGVMGKRNGADVYFEDMKKIKFKYDIQKVFENENDVCVLYDINMSGKVIYTCGLYHVKDGKITSIKVVFDPRPLLEEKK